jgi:quinol-cytochrome oxidoreductase complex cytochrome b subunit
MRALLFGWLTVVTGSVFATLTGGLAFIGMIFGILVIVGYKPVENPDVSRAVIMTFLLACTLVLALILAAIVLRNIRMIRRFRWPTLDEPAERRPTAVRKKDWALGRLAVGVGAISLSWAGILVIGLFMAFFSTSKEPESRELFFLDFVSFPLFVLFGRMCFRWGLQAID